MSEPTISLVIDGLVGRELRLTFDDLTGLPESAQVVDVSRRVPGRVGDGVTLASVLRLAEPKPEANYLTLHADRDDFHVSIPLPPVIDQAILVYRVGESPLSPQAGGPIRMLIPDPTACGTGELDDCANVKYLSRIELCERKGKDTRPLDEAEHAALHARSV